VASGLRGVCWPRSERVDRDFSLRKRGKKRGFSLRRQGRKGKRKRGNGERDVIAWENERERGKREKERKKGGKRSREKREIRN
jgi:hypothetical protein